MREPATENDDLLRELTRRHLFEKCGVGLGAIALSTLLGNQSKAETANQMDVHPPHYAPRAKAVIFLFMAGGPSQLDLFTDKPVLRQLHGQAAAAKLSQRQTLCVPERDGETAGQCAEVQDLRELRSGAERLAAPSSEDRR